MPKISIIIPCYNYGKYILEAIDSVLQSTFQDFEIIVINDGSTDEYTNSLLRSLNRPKTRVVFQRNQGLAQSRNNGINEAKGKYFLPLDADDTIEPTFLEKAYWVMETNESLGFVYPFVQLFGDENYVWKTMQPYNFYDLLFDNQISVCSLVRKKAWEEVNGYNPNMIYGYEDWEFWINMGKHGWLGQNISEPLFNHRKHGVTMTKTALDKRKFLIKQIKKNHPEIYNSKKLRQIKKQWQDFSLLSFFKHNVYLFVKKIVNLKVFPQSIKYLLKNSYQSLKSRLNEKRKITTATDKLNVIDNLFNYETVASPLKTKVLFIVPWLTVGGSEAVLYNLIKILNKDYQAIIATTIKDENIWTKKFEELTPNIYHFPNLFSQIDFAGFISGLIGIYNIKIIYLSNSKLGYEFLKEIKTKNPEIKIIDAVHNHSEDGYLKISGLNDLYIDFHIAINKKIENILINDFKIESDKVKLIYNGIDTEIFNPEKYDKNVCLKLFNLQKNKKIITFIGRLSQEKNPLGFIDIAKKFKEDNDILFVMAGEGKMSKQIKQAIKRHKLKDKVLMLGNVANIPELLKCSYLLVNTSFMEGFSITILEAMSMGVPVIASKIAGNEELVQDNFNGFLAENTPEFVEKIKRLFSDNNKLKIIIENSINFINENYSAKNQYKDIFTS